MRKIAFVAVLASAFSTGLQVASAAPHRETGPESPVTVKTTALNLLTAVSRQDEAAFAAELAPGAVFIDERGKAPIRSPLTVETLRHFVRDCAPNNSGNVNGADVYIYWQCSTDDYVSTGLSVRNGRVTRVRVLQGPPWLTTNLPVTMSKVRFPETATGD